MERRGYAYMIASSVCFAVMGLWVKLASSRLPFYEVTFFRAFGGLILIAGWMVVSRQSFRLRDPLVLIWRGVLGWAALTAYFYAISRLYLADAVLLNYTSPFFTALLAALLLGERLTWRTATSLALATAGVAFVVGPKGGFWNWGAVSGLGSGVFAALAYVAVKRATLTNTAWGIVFAFSLVASVLTLPLMVTHYVAPTGREWGWLFGVATSATLAQITMTFGYRYARASTASIVSLFTPFCSAIIAVWLLQDLPTWGTWLGGALIIGAGMTLALES